MSSHTRDSKSQPRSQTRKQIRPFMKVSLMLKKLHANVSNHDGQEGYVNTNVHFIDQKLVDFWSSQKFEGHMSSKDFYIKSAEEAYNFSYHYYLGRHMSPQIIEKNQRRLDLTPLYNMGQIEVTIVDEQFDVYPKTVQIFEKMKSQFTHCKLLMNQNLQIDKIELSKSHDVEGSFQMSKYSSIQCSGRHQRCHQMTSKLYQSYKSSPSQGSKMSKGSQKSKSVKSKKKRTTSFMKSQGNLLRPSSVNKIEYLKQSLNDMSLNQDHQDKQNLSTDSMKGYQRLGMSQQRLASKHFDSLQRHTDGTKSETSLTLKVGKDNLSPRFHNLKKKSHVIQSTSQLRNDRTRNEQQKQLLTDDQILVSAAEKQSKKKQFDQQKAPQVQIELVDDNQNIVQLPEAINQPDENQREQTDTLENDQIKEEQMDYVPSLVPLDDQENNQSDSQDGKQINDDNALNVEEGQESSIQDEIMNQGEHSSLPMSSIPYEVYTQNEKREEEVWQKPMDQQPLMETLLPTDEEGGVSEFVNNHKHDMICNIPFNKNDIDFTATSQDRTESKGFGPSKTWQLNSQGRSNSSNQVFSGRLQQVEEVHSTEELVMMQSSLISPKGSVNMRQNFEASYSTPNQKLNVLLTQDELNYIRYCNLHNDYLCTDDELVQQLKLELQVLSDKKKDNKKERQSKFELLANSFEVPLELVRFINDFKMNTKQNLSAHQVISIRRAFLQTNVNKIQNAQFETLDKISETVGLPKEYIENEIKLFQNSQAKPIEDASFIGRSDKIELDLYLLNAVRTTIPYNMHNSERMFVHPSMSMEEQLLQQGKCFCQRYRYSWQSHENPCLNIVLISTVRNQNNNLNEKQVFIDSLVNYLLGIEYNQSFRYTLVVNQKQVQADQQSLATVYHIESQWMKNSPIPKDRQPMSINIIDVETVPYSKKDSQSNVQAIMSRLMNQMEHIDFIFLVNRDSDRLKNLGQMRWIYFCLQSKFKSNVKERVIEINIKTPQNSGEETYTDHNSSVSSFNVQYEGFQLEHRFEFDALGLFQRNLDLANFECFDFNYQTFSSLMHLVGDIWSFQPPLSIHQSEDDTQIKFMIDQKIAQITNNVRLLVLKLAQRNCLKKEFLEMQKAIDSQRHFSRSEKIISTIYSSPQSEGSQYLNENRYNIIQCQKCRGVSGMCGILTKPSFEYFNELPKIKTQKVANQNQNGQKVVTEHPVIINQKCNLMNGNYCRFCNHHINDHIFHEDGTGKFEISEGEVVVIYDTNVLRQQAETSNNVQIRMNSNIWSNTQLLLCTLMDEQIECLNQLERLISGQLRECVNQLRQLNAKRQMQQIPVFQIGDYLFGLKAHFEDQQTKYINPQPKIEIMKLLNQVIERYESLKASFDTKVSKISDTIQIQNQNHKLSWTEKMCGGCCTSQPQIQTQRQTQFMAPSPLSPRQNMIVSDQFVHLRVEKKIFSSLQQKLLNELKQVKIINRLTNQRQEIPIKNIVRADKWFNELNISYDNMYNQNTSYHSNSMLNDRQTSTPKAKNIWSSLTGLISQKRQSRTDELTSKSQVVGQKSSQFQSQTPVTSENKKISFDHLQNDSKFRNRNYSTYQKTANQSFENNVQLDQKRHSQLIMNKKMNIMSGEYLFKQKSVFQVNNNKNQRGSALNNSTEWRKNSVGQLAVDGRLLNKRDSHQAVLANKHYLSQQNIMSPQGNSFSHPMRTSVDHNSSKFFSEQEQKQQRNNINLNNKSTNNLLYQSVGEQQQMKKIDQCIKELSPRSSSNLSRNISNKQLEIDVRPQNYSYLDLKKQKRNQFKQQKDQKFRS